MYFAVMLLLWTLVAAIIAGNGREMHTAIPDVALYGVQAGYWVIAGFALFDRIAREMVSGGANRFLFALFAVPYALVTWPFIKIWPVTAYPIDLQSSIPAPIHAAPFAAVLLCYLVRPDKPKLASEDEAGAEDGAAA